MEALETTSVALDFGGFCYIILGRIGASEYQKLCGENCLPFQARSEKSVLLQLIMVLTLIS